jgi:glycosyltransferase involved in cell wall biosynthesis
MRVRPQRHRSWAGFTALHLVQPVDAGVAAVVTDLAGAQTASGMRVVVVCPEGGTLAESARGRGADVLVWRATREPGPSLVHEVRQVCRLVSQVRPDLIHAHSAKAGLAGRLAVRGRVPTVFQPHAWSFEAIGGTTGRLALTWERWATRWTWRVVCVSEAERRTGERAGIEASWSVVRNGVDVTRFRPVSRPVARAALPLLAGLPATAPVVICVGRLCRQKGQDTLLRAWRSVSHTFPEARLVLVGDGPDAAALRAGAPPSVLFSGSVQHTAPWYAAADLVVLPSRWEGMAVAPLEAMACGRPVLLSDVDGARESLPPGREATCLVPPDDPRALAAALGALLRDAALRDTLGRESRQYVLRCHDVRQTGSAIVELYRDLAATPRPEHREPMPQ